jgi:hypothetical protein
MMSGVEVTGRTRPAQHGLLELMPAGDGRAQLFDQRLGLGWYLAVQAGDGRYRVRVLPRRLQAGLLGPP